MKFFFVMKNMGCWKSRLDEILYSRGKYIILFVAGSPASHIGLALHRDLYEDN